MSQADWVWATSEVIPSEPGAGRRILEQLVERLHQAGWDQHGVFSVNLAVEEALVNAIRHGNCCDASKRVHYECKLWSDRVWVQITDEGPGFRPEEVPDPTAPENLETPGGRGIMLMRNFMSRVEYNATGNCVVMEKCRPATESAEG